MIAFRRVVPQDRGRLPPVQDHRVNVAVVIQIGKCRTAAGEFYRQTVPALLGYVDELSFSRVHQHDISHLIARRVVDFPDITLEVSADAHGRFLVDADVIGYTGYQPDLCELALSVIPEQEVCFVVVGHVDVNVPIAVTAEQGQFGRLFVVAGSVETAAVGEPLGQACGGWLQFLSDELIQPQNGM